MKKPSTLTVFRHFYRLANYVAAGAILVSGTFAATDTVHAAASAADVVIKDAWIREAPPNAKMLAGYFTITNQGKAAKTLNAINCAAFEKVEMHKTVKKGNMSSMVEQKELLLKSGESVKFSPGGYHLMLMHPKSVIKSGQQHEITLHFADKTSLTLPFPVKKSQATEDEHMHMHNHGEHSMEQHDMHDETPKMEHQHHDQHNM